MTQVFGRYVVNSDPFAEWDGSPAQARILQKQMATQVLLHDDFGAPRRYAGVDVGFEEGGEITRAVAVCWMPRPCSHWPMPSPASPP